MSFVAAFELMVDMTQFQNIDLLHQGRYQIRVMLETQAQDIIYPYLIVETEKATIQQSFQSHLHTIDLKEQGFMDDRYLYSKPFTVNYCEQIVDLDDICVFRIQFKSDTKNSVVPEIKLRFSLLFNDPDSEQMSEVSSQTWIIKDANQCISEFFLVTFDEQNLCSCKVYVHSIQIYYKFSQQFKNMSLLAEFDIYVSKATQQYYKKGLQEFIYSYIESMREIQKKYHMKLLSLQNHMPQEQKQNFLNEIQKIPTVLTKMITQISMLSTNQISEYIYELNVSIQSSLCILWNLFIQTYRTYKIVINQHLSGCNSSLSLKNLVVQKVIYSTDFAKAQFYDVDPSRNESSKIIRDNVKFIKTNTVEDYSFLTQPERWPILYETRFHRENFNQLIQLSNNLNQTDTEKQFKHLIVFVHGYQGSSIDFRQWKSHFYIKHPQFIFLSSSINEDDTDIDIQSLGINLAKEIKGFIQVRMLYQKSFRLSIIGHSLGGLISRVAILHLDQYQKNLHTFVSLASPHIGLGAQHSKLVGTGLWLLKKINKGCKSLDQMTMSDSTQYDQTLIWKLSQNSKLNLFKNVFIVYSQQDMYVPYHSAGLINVNGNQGISKNHNQLIINLMSNFTNDKLIKLDVCFPILKTSLDSMIGRTAHIQFLENSLFIRTFIETYSQYFV